MLQPAQICDLLKGMVSCLVFKVMLTLPPFCEWHVFKMYIQEISHQDIYSL